MDGLVWGDLENSTAGLEDADDNSPAATAMVWKNASGQRQSVPANVSAAVGLAITTFGVLTNSGLLAVLVRARRQFGSSVHTLITNQCAIDLYTSVFGMCMMAMLVAGTYHYNNN